MTTFRPAAGAAKCAFCNHAGEGGVEARGHRVCDACVALCRQRLGIDDLTGDLPLPPNHACSFCDGAPALRRDLLAAPTLYICRACVAEADGLIASTN